MNRNRSTKKKWKQYSNLGKQVLHTRFVPFKVPIKAENCKEWGSLFTTEDVLASYPNLKLVVDLTNVDDGRYYNAHGFRSRGVQIAKMKCPGGPNQVPSKHQLHMFYNIIDNFLNNHPEPNSLIGVHCTHGLNRTGYFICKYMIDKLKIEPQKAIKHFESARGHHMKRQLLINDILCSTTQYAMQAHSPLDNCYEYDGPGSSNGYRSNTFRRY